MQRFVSGVLAAGSTVGMIALVMFPVNVAARSYAARKLAQDPNNTTAEAILYGF